MCKQHNEHNLILRLFFWTYIKKIGTQNNAFKTPFPEPNCWPWSSWIVSTIAQKNLCISVSLFDYTQFTYWNSVLHGCHRIFVRVFILYGHYLGQRRSFASICVFSNYIYLAELIIEENQYTELKYDCEASVCDSTAGNIYRYLVFFRVTTKPNILAYKEDRSSLPYWQFLWFLAYAPSWWLQ